MDYNVATLGVTPSPEIPTVLLSWQVPSIDSSKLFLSSQFGEIYPFGPNSSGWIDDAIRQLEDVNIEAEEEGYPLVNDKAKKIAVHLLKMLDRHRIEPDVYPSMDGDIAIYFKAPNRPLSFLITIDNGQRIECYAVGVGDCGHIGFEALSEKAVQHMHDVLDKMESPIVLQGGFAGTLR